MLNSIGINIFTHHNLTIIFFPENGIKEGKHVKEDSLMEIRGKKDWCYNIPYIIF